MCAFVNIDTFIFSYLVARVALADETANCVDTPAIGTDFFPRTFINVYAFAIFTLYESAITLTVMCLEVSHTLSVLTTRFLAFQTIFLIVAYPFGIFDKTSRTSALV